MCLEGAMNKFGILVFLLILVNFINKAQDLIVNEWSQGADHAKEWVEVLIVTDNFNIQDYKLIDGNNSLELVFSGSGFQNLKMGSLIVFYNGGDVDILITPDLNYDGVTDKTLQVSSLNNSGTWAITRTKGWSGVSGAFNNNTVTDVPQILNSSSTNIFTTPKHAGANSFAFYTGNSAAGALLGANWNTGTPSSGASPAAGNGGDNSTWINTVLPVELSSFSASLVNNGVRLNWRTETEVNNYGFEIEREVGSRQSVVSKWDVIGFVEGHGNSNSPKEYLFIDDEITSGQYAYRLKQIDNDGKFEYSKIIEIDVDAPLEFELSQNYPNPFNPSTTIKFSLPITSNVKLSVFNILGEEVQILVNDTKEAGVYTINFDVSQLNSGIYFYKLETRNFLEVKKMSLIR
jgi:hypothetical protein